MEGGERGDVWGWVRVGVEREERRVQCGGNDGEKEGMREGKRGSEGTHEEREIREGRKVREKSVREGVRGDGM